MTTAINNPKDTDAHDQEPTPEGAAANNPKQNKRITGFIEFLGSFILVFAGTSAICYFALHHSPHVLLYASIWFGIVLALQVYIWHNSGCHLNWLVTIGLVSAKKFPKEYRRRYLCMQLLGSIAGAYATYLRFGDKGVTAVMLGSAIPAPHGAWWWQLFGAFVSGFVFVLAVIQLAGDNRAKGQMAGLVIGAVLGLDIYFSAKFTGGGVNTPRELAPLLVSILSGKAHAPQFGKMLFLLVVYSFEIFGATTAGRLYRWLSKAENPSET